MGWAKRVGVSEAVIKEFRNKSRYKKRFYKSKRLYSIKESNQCFLGTAAFLVVFLAWAHFLVCLWAFLGAAAFLVAFLAWATLATLGAATFFAAARAIKN